MAGRLSTNLVAEMNARAGDLASAQDPREVKSILEDVQATAVQRSQIPDTFIYRLTVAVLGFAVVSVIVAQVWITLAPGDKEIPEGIIAIGSAAIGALAGLLAPTPSS